MARGNSQIDVSIALDTSPQLPKELKIDFIEYWCEGKKKMRWQKQPTFDISLRLKRWQKNQKK